MPTEISHSSDPQSSWSNHAPGTDSDVGQNIADKSFLLEASLLVSLFMAILLLSLIADSLPAEIYYSLLGLFIAAGIGITIFSYHLVNNKFLKPLKSLNEWAGQTASGQLEAFPGQDGFAGFHDISKNIYAITAQLQDLGRNMEAHVRERVREHTEHIEKKNHTLEIIYDVAASINSSRDLEELLTRFLETLKNVVNARAAIVRLITADGQMRLVSSLGLDEELIKREQLLPSEQCMCGSAYREGAIYQQDIGKCDKIIGRNFFNAAGVGMIAVPLQYRDKILGVYNLFVDNDDFVDPEDMTLLLTNIGRHLGMAIDKARSDDEANRLSIMEERTRLAHELHDSLAQTLASLRFQIRVLDETIRQGQEPAIWHELEKIENNIDEAYSELRELITHFRAPIDKRGLIPAVEHLVERFRNQCDISIFLQKEWNVLHLPASIEVQALRIVQEALNNIRKHSQAHTVRVILRSDTQGDCKILIEDDGVGMNVAPQSDRISGDHLGLSIMEERARRIGGTAQIESEPSEGTRIFLHFHYPELDTTESNSINVQPPGKI
ncbi:MAG: histidine kinase [Gammaproteobacteria bacterium]|nr:histidine kinase [Gammaproteobacteria bacterium]